jgi:hypothetical protein
LKKRIASDYDSVLWVVEEAFVKDEYGAAKKAAGNTV